MNKYLTDIIIYSLLIIGLIFIAIASLSEAFNQFSDPLFFVKRQIIWDILGITAYLLISRIKLNFIQKIAPLLYFFSLAALFAVLLPTWGSKILGARRWFEIWNISIQPSEICKLSTVIFFSQLFSQPKNRNLKNLILYLTPIVFLIILQPNLSTAIIITLIAVSLYYLSGAEIIPLFLVSSLAAVISLLLIITSPYRFSRLQALIQPTSEISSSSYHSRQITLAFASGGLFGKGLANSQQKYRFLPKIPTDSILAIIGEETGFLGISFIICLYIILVSRLSKLAAKIDSGFKFLFISGVTCWIAYQSLINISSLASLIPLTGIPLPLVSYGGSSVFTLLLGLGIIKSIKTT